MTTTIDTETWMLTNEQLTDRVACAFKTKAQAEAACATLMAAVQDRDLVSLAGASSQTSWLTNLTGVPRGEASRTVRQAENLNEELEPTLRVWTTGDLPTQKATTIFEAINSLPEWVGLDGRARAQTTLLDFATRFSCQDLKRLANHILEVIDPVGAEEHLRKQLEKEEQRAWLKTSFSMCAAGDPWPIPATQRPSRDAQNRPRRFSFPPQERPQNL